MSLVMSPNENLGLLQDLSFFASVILFLWLQFLLELIVFPWFLLLCLQRAISMQMQRHKVLRVICIWGLCDVTLFTLEIWCNMYYILFLCVFPILIPLGEMRFKLFCWWTTLVSLWHCQVLSFEPTLAFPSQEGPPESPALVPTQTRAGRRASTNSTYWRLPLVRLNESYRQVYVLLCSYFKI
jgi:hypothetical protein